jgi:hypothetical protein
MDRPLILAAALALSLLAALAAAAQFVDHFWYGEDLSLFVLPISGFVLVAFAVFVMAGARVQSSRTLAALAIGLAIAALLLVAAPFLVTHIAAQSKNPDLSLRARDPQIRTTLLIPMLLAIVIQWWTVQRSWLKARGLDHRTAWPWITTIVACVVALSPIGIAILDAAVRQSPTDWLRGVWLMMALCFGGLVLLLGLIEWFVRRRKLNAARAPALSG